MNKIIFVPSGYTELKSWELLFLSLSKNDNFDLNVYLHENFDNHSEALNYCKSLNLNIERFCFNNESFLAQFISFCAIFYSRVFNSRLKIFIPEFFFILPELFILALQKIKIRRRFLKIKPHLVVLSDDRDGVERIIVAFCKIYRIPTILYSFGIQLNFQKQISITRSNLFKRNNSTKTLFNKFIAIIFPKMTYMFKNEKILFKTGSEIIADKVLLNLPGSPWIYGSSGVDSIGVWCEAISEHYELSGTPKDKITITGLPHDKEMELILKNPMKMKISFRNLYHFDDNQIFLFNLPPMHSIDERAVNNYLGFESLFSFYCFIFDLLLSKEINLIVSAHPRVIKSELIKLQDKYSNDNIVFSNKRIETLVPIADCLISDYSTIMGLAAHCSIPIISLDVYGFNYDIYNNISANQKPITNEEEAKKTLNEFIKTKKYDKNTRIKNLKWDSQMIFSLHSVNSFFNELINKFKD